jgi:Transcriptional regulators
MPRPLARYREIEQWLTEKCRALPAGSPLPSETEIASTFGVSRMTARQAMVNLNQAGLVERRRGAGTFVAPSRLHRLDNVLLSFTEDMARRGMTAQSRVLSATVATSPDNAVALGLAPTAWLVCIDRVRLADGVPLARERVFLPGDFRDVLDSDLQNGSLHVALTRLGRVIAGARGYVTARLATTEEAELLGLVYPAVLLVERRTITDKQGNPIEHTETAYVASRWVIDTGSFSSQRGSSEASTAAPTAPAAVPSIDLTTTNDPSGTSGVRRRSSSTRG